MKKHLYFILITYSLFSIEIQYSVFGGMTLNRLDAFQAKFNSKVFIETGTHWGETTINAAPIFESVYSIELSEELFELSTENLQMYSNIQLINGDSEIELDKLLKDIGARSTFFFLDAHWSGGDTVKGRNDPPAISELEIIGKYAKADTVVLINDVRCFKSAFSSSYLKSYPDLSELKVCMENFFPKNFKFVVIGDQALIYKPSYFRDRVSKGAKTFTDLCLEKDETEFIKLAKTFVSVATAVEKDRVLRMSESQHASHFICFVASLIHREKRDLLSQERFIEKAKEKGLTIDY